jgi:prolyl oligopeptidase
MRFRRSLLATSILLLAACSASESPAPTAQAPAAEAASPKAAAKLSYPAARTVDQVDDYHGEKVADPYRWMEDLDSPELAQWIEAQNKVTQRYLADTPRDAIAKRLGELWNYDRYADDRGGLVPVARNGRYFFSRNDGLQNQYVVHVQDGLDGAERVLLDPNGLSSDGTVSLSEMAVSGDGGKLAYSISNGGSDWRTIKVRDVATGQDLPDEIRWAKFTGIEWATDGGGFWYARFDEPKGENELKAVNKFQKLYFHKLGTPQSEDALVYERKDQPDWGFAAHASDDGGYLLIAVSQGTDTRNRMFFRELDDANAQVVELIPELKASYDYVGNEGPVFYFHTDDGAERYRMIAIDTTNPEPGKWHEVIPQSEGTLANVSHVNGQFIADYLKDAHAVVRVFDADGKPVRDVALPGPGSVLGFRGTVESKETFFNYASYLSPWTPYRYDAVTGEVSRFKAPRSAFDPAPYETRQVFYPSKDGTRIPMFITARRDLVLDGTHPTILFGYGGFNSSQTPSYNPAFTNVTWWLEQGGVYAVANLRGGGEYGRPWHEAGMKTRRQNVFDDFAAAAEYLVAQKWTQPAKLAIRGRSNGGLLVGAAMIQRPELYAAALPVVGVMDMLRFREFTIGWAWESDYGSVKNADEYKAIRAFSPLHNLKPGVKYPATLITTADRDDRVFPAHSFKFAAALQAAYQGDQPMLIRVETRAGHGSGTPTAKIIEENTDMFAFLTKTLDMAVH